MSWAPKSRTAHQTIIRLWHHRGPRDRLSLGAAVHPAADRRGTTLSSRGRDRWFVDETYVTVVGQWVDLYRAIDQYGQVIDVLVSEKRDLAATGRFFTRALEHGTCPTEVSTDRAPAYPRVLDELLSAVCHVMAQYANNPAEADHGQFKPRLRAMRGLNKLRSARVISTGHAFVPEPPPRPLRTRCRCRLAASAPGGLRRTRPRHLIGNHSGQPCPFSSNATMLTSQPTSWTEIRFSNAIESVSALRDWFSRSCR